MPSYYNPYMANQGGNFLMGGASFSPYVQQPYPYGNTSAQQSQMATMKPIEWVEGEVGAKAYQMPVGLPANQPIPLWDSTDTIIYLKSWNHMGMPNPLQVIRYQMSEQPQNLPAHASQTVSATAQPETNYVTKDEYNDLKNSISELKEMFSKINQNGGNYAKNQRYKEDRDV